MLRLSGTACGVSPWSRTAQGLEVSGDAPRGNMALSMLNLIFKQPQEILTLPQFPRDVFDQIRPIFLKENHCFLHILGCECGLQLPTGEPRRLLNDADNESIENETPIENQVGPEHQFATSTSSRSQSPISSPSQSSISSPSQSPPPAETLELGATDGEDLCVSCNRGDDGEGWVACDNTAKHGEANTQWHHRSCVGLDADIDMAEGKRLALKSAKDVNILTVSLVHWVCPNCQKEEEESDEEESDDDDEESDGDDEGKDDDDYEDHRGNGKKRSPSPDTDGSDHDADDNEDDDNDDTYQNRRRNAGKQPAEKSIAGEPNNPRKPPGTGKPTQHQATHKGGKAIASKTIPVSNDAPTHPRNAPTIGARAMPWTKIQKDAVEAELRQVIREGQVNRTEQRWVVIQDRLHNNHGITRTPTAIKNYWNREGRLSTGLDERNKPRPYAMVTGVQNPEDRKRARQKNKLTQQKGDVDGAEIEDDEGDDIGDEEVEDEEDEGGPPSKRQRRN